MTTKTSTTVLEGHSKPRRKRREPGRARRTIIPRPDDPREQAKRRWVDPILEDIRSEVGRKDAHEHHVSIQLTTRVLWSIANLDSFVDQGHVYVSQNGISDRVLNTNEQPISDRQARRVVAFLEDRKHLKIERTRGTRNIMRPIYCAANGGHDDRPQRTPCPYSPDSMSSESSYLNFSAKPSSPPTPSEPLADWKEECGPSEVGARAVDIATHSEAWEATDEFGGNHAAFAAEWKRAPYEATAKITAWIRRGGRLPTGNQYPANWLKHGLWENLGAPKAVPDQIEEHRGALGALDAPLREMIDPAQFRSWFIGGEAQLVSKTDDTVTISVKSDFYAKSIANRFADKIAQASGVPGLEFFVREDARR